MILAIFLISIFTFLFLGVPVAFSILLTVLISCGAALLFPVKNNAEEAAQ